MLTIIITWIYALFTISLLGFGVVAFIEKVFHYNIEKPDSILMAGTVAATVYAQFFSLFYRVSLAANVGMLVCCAVIFVFNRNNIIRTICKWHQEWEIGYKILMGVLFVLWAYFTSRGYIHYDSDLYHAQSIRWLEEYGVVPGLGNLHERFAYNSSFFALCALYSLKYILGDSMHAMNGFLALLLSLTCLPIVKSWKQKRFSVADFARVGAIYYLTTITNEVVSPASDYAVMCVIFFIVIKWLDALEEECNDIAPYALLCVVGVYALSIKLTAGLILMLLIKPAYMLIREKRVKEIFIYLVMGLVVAIPWMVRTVIISGWLFYPFTAIDLFDVDWKMDAFYIDVDAMQIKVWGRALYAIGLIDVPITGWFPNWFATTLSGMEKILILGCIAAMAITLISICVILVRRQFKHLDMLLVMITLLSSYLFWQTSAPLIRYGYAYVLLFVFVVFGWCLQELFPHEKGDRFAWRRMLHRGVYIVFCLYGIYKGCFLGYYIYSSRLAEHYICQQDYGVYEVESYEIEGVTFYYPISGDRTGYDYFPASGAKVNLEFRGASIKDGFRKIFD
ncbi:MAG: hypothetical protein IKK03_12870 [Lachnospiraceae bacterium]|nr:hypothetical protein [Lachnospiraceae bacterium]